MRVKGFAIVCIIAKVIGATQANFQLYGVDDRSFVAKGGALNSTATPLRPSPSMALGFR
jgi:hypothetical protein